MSVGPFQGVFNPSTRQRWAIASTYKNVTHQITRQNPSTTRQDPGFPKSRRSFERRRNQLSTINHQLFSFAPTSSCANIRPQSSFAAASGIVCWCRTTWLIVHGRIAKLVWNWPMTELQSTPSEDCSSSSTDNLAPVEQYWDQWRWSHSRSSATVARVL